jgi:hypothetical protein
MAALVAAIHVFVTKNAAPRGKPEYDEQYFKYEAVI